MARLGKQIPSSLHGANARPAPHPIRTRLSSTSKQQETYRRPVVKVNHGIVEKILLVLFAACVLLFTITLLR